METLALNLNDIDKIILLGGRSRKTAAQIFASLSDKPDYLINAGMYDTKSGITVCDTMIDGEVINGGNYTDKGFGWCDNDLRPATTSTAKVIGCNHFLGGSPSLVWLGKLDIDSKGFDSYFISAGKSLRIGMGIAGDKLVIGYTNIPVKLSAFASDMLAAGCTYAINLDGGGSTSVMKNKSGKLTAINKRSEDRANSTWLAVYLKQRSSDKMKVCIDAGHGGLDPGALGAMGAHEKDIALTVGKLVGQALERNSIDVVYTRTEDKRLVEPGGEPDLTARANVANQSSADCFVSIHCNSAADKSAHGTETYAYSTSSQGYPLAKMLQDKMTAATGLTNRGVKTANYAVLRKTTMPAALVELAFISNAQEELLLINPTWQAKVADAIAQGIVQHLGLVWVPTAAKAGQVKLMAGDKVQMVELVQDNRDGVVWAPVRDVLALVGHSVGWDDTNKVVVIYK